MTTDQIATRSHDTIGRPRGGAVSTRAQVITLLLSCSIGCASAPWTLIVLPDTQVYAEKYPETFVAQTRWIREQAEARNIRFVVHVGDVVEHNNEAEWDVARKAFALLDPVPYAIALGNHDLGPNGTATTRETLWWQEPNAMHLFHAGGRDWIVLALEWGPRDQVIGWANDRLTQHATRSAIIVTHAYLHSDGKRADHRDASQRWNPHEYGTEGGVNDGEELWTKLVSRHPNVVLVISGHYGENGGAARLTSTGVHGNPVHQILSDYQLGERGGDGYLRVMEVGEREIRVSTHSPVRGDQLEDGANRFVLALPEAR